MIPDLLAPNSSRLLTIRSTIPKVISWTRKFVVQTCARIMVAPGPVIQSPDHTMDEKRTGTKPDASKKIVPVQYVIPLIITGVITNSICRSFSESEVVTVLVGADKHPFRIYKQLLCDKIPYFEACLKSDWRSHDSSPVELDDIDVDAFRVVVRWLFNEALSIPSRDSTFTQHDLENVYQIADRLMLAKLQNALIDAAIESLKPNDAFKFGKLQSLRDRNLSHTLLYRLVLKSAVRSFMVKVPTKEMIVDELKSIADPNLFREIIVSIYEYNGKPWPRPVNMADRSEFYVGDANEESKRESPISNVEMAKKRKRKDVEGDDSSDESVILLLD